MFSRAAFLFVVLAQMFKPPVDLSQAPRVSAGPYEIVLRLPPGGLSAGEEMQIEFRLLDTRPAQGPRPVLFAKLRGVVDMPTMPSMPRFDEIAHREGVPGEYGVHPTFSHGGDYRLVITLSPPGEPPLDFEFPLDVADAAPPNPRSRVRSIPFSLAVATTPASPVAGQPTRVELGVRRENVLITGPDDTFSVGDAPVEEFDLAHERPMHLFVVRQDLGTFAHEHPAPTGPGAFRLSYAFPSGGTYRVFAEVAPKNAGSQILSGEIKVGGIAGEPYRVAVAFASDAGLKRTVEGVEVEWSVPGPLPVQKTFVLEGRLRDASGGVLALEPWLGSLGHLMMIHQDGQTFVHCHPDEREPAAAKGPVLTIPFLVRFPKPGLYRGWGQFQRGGRLLTADFVVRAG